VTIVKSLELAERDWREIYYACETKLKDIEAGNYGDLNEEEIAAWAAHLRSIIEKIEALGLVL